MLSPLSILLTFCPEAWGASCEYEVNVNTAPRADLVAGAFSTFHELTQSWCENSYFQRIEISSEICSPSPCGLEGASPECFASCEWMLSPSVSSLVPAFLPRSARHFGTFLLNIWHRTPNLWLAFSVLQFRFGFSLKLPCGMHTKVTYTLLVAVPLCCSFFFFSFFFFFRLLILPVNAPK